MTPRDRLLYLLDRAELFLSQITAELFAARNPKQQVNAYQSELQKAYSDWVDSTASDLAKAKESDREKILAAALLVLLALLQRMGHDSLPDAIDSALAGADSFPALAALLSEQIDENDGYLEESLIPDLDTRGKATLIDPVILAAIAAGAGVEAIAGALGGFTARVGNYSGEWWDTFNRAVGLIADENKSPVTWYLDPLSSHCRDCPRFGSVEGKTYPSYAAMLEETGGATPANGVECESNCRCELRFG